MRAKGKDALSTWSSGCHLQEEKKARGFWERRGALGAWGQSRGPCSPTRFSEVSPGGSGDSFTSGPVSSKAQTGSKAHASLSCPV